MCQLCLSVILIEEKNVFLNMKKRIVDKSIKFYQMSKFSKQEMLASAVIYDDENIKIRQKCVTLKTYYFPIATSKRIPIDQIKNIKILNVGFNGRVWGMGVDGSSIFWMPCDSKRLGSSNVIILETGNSIKPSFTCCDNSKAFHIIKGLIAKNSVQNATQAMIGVK